MRGYGDQDNCVAVQCGKNAYKNFMLVFLACSRGLLV